MNELTNSKENLLAGTTAIVTGASRGFGRAITVALHGAGAHVVAVARKAEPLSRLREELGDRLTIVAEDAADPNVAGLLLEEYRPRTLVLNAGAAPLMRPLQYQTRQTFSRNWDVDVQQAFNWIREALLLPLEPQSTVITFSSGAVLFGSPLSGGYAGAKAMIRYMTDYAAAESERAGLNVRFVSVLPSLTGATELGAVAVKAYAGRAGLTVDEFVNRQGPPLDADLVGMRVVELATSAERDGAAFLLTPKGLTRYAPDIA